MIGDFRFVAQNIKSKSFDYKIMLFSMSEKFTSARMTEREADL